LGAEIGQTGQVLRQYVYLESRPVAMLSGSSIYAIHTDHRLAPIAVTDSERRVVWQADVHDDGAADVLPASTIELPLRASNQYFDAETGLHYNLNRYLDAVRGRYLSPDPLGLATGPDLYQFALGRPHQFIDVLGLQTSSTDWSQKSQADRLIAIVQAAIPKLPSAIGSALAQLVKPSSLATTIAIMGLFAAAQTTAIGWVADAVLVGLSVWSLGSGALELAKMLVQLYKDAQNAKCNADINAAAQRLANSFVDSNGKIAAGLIGLFGVAKSGGFTRIANGLNGLIDFAETRLGAGTAAAAAGAASWTAPSVLVRVIPNGIPATTLGAPGAVDVFVTTPEAIAGLDAAGIAARLGIPESPTGFQVIQFPAPPAGLASPVFRPNPGFVGGGVTSGGAPEFVIPNGPIPPGATITVVR
jgi:RHS repeat-associated protein